MKTKASILLMATVLVAACLSHAQDNCVTCLDQQTCTSSVPDGYCTCFFGDNGCQGLDACKNGQCLIDVKSGSCPSATSKTGNQTRIGPDFSTNKDMSKALVDNVDAHSHTLSRLLRLLLPHIAKGSMSAGGYLGTKDHTDQTQTTYTSKNGEFTFTIDHPVSPDTSDAPTRLVVHGHEWALYSGSSEVASGTLSVVNPLDIE